MSAFNPAVTELGFTKVTLLHPQSVDTSELVRRAQIPMPCSIYSFTDTNGEKPTSPYLEPAVNESDLLVVNGLLWESNSPDVKKMTEIILSRSVAKESDTKRKLLRIVDFDSQNEDDDTFDDYDFEHIGNLVRLARSR